MDHRTPIAYKQLPDTDWCLIKTKDDCEFYYHWPSGQKSWDLPPELEILMGDLIAQSMVWEGQDRESESKEAFMALLMEKVSPFGSFESEMTRIAHDERFRAVSQRDQKALFDQFCQSRSAQLLEKKNAGLDTRKEDYLKLLQQYANPKTPWAEFQKRYKRNPAFMSMEVRQREPVFEAFIKEAKEQEAERKKQQYENAKNDFMDLLSTVDQKILEQGWKKTKKEIDQDPRYKGVKVIADREAFYKEFLHVPSAKPLVPQETVPTVSLDKKARQEASLRERQEQVQKEREANERAYKNQKSHLVHGESETIFKSILIDMVKSHTARWKDYEASLQNDLRFPDVALSPSECSALFHRHTRDLFDKAVQAFHMLLDTIVRPDSDWKSVFPMIENEPRVLRLEKSYTELESLFNSYKKGQVGKLRQDFSVALKECTFLDFHIRQALQSALSEHKGSKELGFDQIWPFVNLEELSAILENDKRYLEMEVLQKERDGMIRDYIHTLVDRIQAEKGGVLDRTLATHAGGRS